MPHRHKLPEQPNPWKTLTNEVVYENPWIRVSHRDVINPSGNPGIYGLIHFKNHAVGVVPIDETNHTWLVGQYRYAMDCYSWEIPEGGCPKGQTPLEAAKRELLEETGISALDWTEIGNYHISNSVTDEAGTLFVARQLSFGQAAPEETEDLMIRRVPFSTAYEMVLNNDIKDTLSVIAILRTQLYLQGKG